MKKIFALLLIVCLAFALVACKQDNPDETPKCNQHADANYDGVCDTDGCGAAVEVDVMTYAEYDAAELEEFVIIDAYVQAHQSWWDNKICLYLADEDGAYFAYNVACSEEDAAKLTTGTKIRVYGYKKCWDGVIEIMDGNLHILGGDTYVAQPIDVTAKLNSEEILAHRNQFVKFTDMTISEISYKNSQPGDDIYVTFTNNGVSYNFCVEKYLTGTSTDLYKLFTQGTLEVGDVVDVEAFLYWWSGDNNPNDFTAINPHIVSITNINE